MAKVFFNASEEVSWNVAGFLLAWRIVMAPEVGSIRYSAGNSKYVLEKGNETSVTQAFLRDQRRSWLGGNPQVSWYWIYV